MYEISVIIRGYNNENTIERAITSVLNNDFDINKLEILLVNDGSSDNTLEIMKKYEDKARIITHENMGAMPTLNDAIKKSTGKYIILLDADDEFEKDMLKLMYESIMKNSEIKFVYADYREINEQTGEEKIVETDNILNIIAIGVLFEKKVLEEFDYYSEALLFPEHDLMLKISKKYAGVRIKKPLFKYYRNPNSLTANKEYVEKGLQQLKNIHGDLEFKEY